MTDLMGTRRDARRHRGTPRFAPGVAAIVLIGVGALLLFHRIGSDRKRVVVEAPPPFASDSPPASVSIPAPPADRELQEPAASPVGWQLQVVDDRSQPLADAVLSFVSALQIPLRLAGYSDVEAGADEHGVIHLTHWPASAYALVTAPGHREQMLPPRAAEAHRQVIRLERLIPAAVAGLVLAADGTPVEAVRVQAVPLATDPVVFFQDRKNLGAAEARSDASGRFEIRNAPTNVALRIVAGPGEDHVPGFVNIPSLRPAERREDVIVRLQRSRNVTLQVRDSVTGQPVASAWVMPPRHLWAENDPDSPTGPPIGMARTDDAGRAILAAVAGVPLTIEVSARSQYEDQVVRLAADESEAVVDLVPLGRYPVIIRGLPQPFPCPEGIRRFVRGKVLSGHGGFLGGPDRLLHLRTEPVDGQAGPPFVRESVFWNSFPDDGELRTERALPFSVHAWLVDRELGSTVVRSAGDRVVLEVRPQEFCRRGSMAFRVVHPDGSPFVDAFRIHARFKTASSLPADVALQCEDELLAQADRDGSFELGNLLAGTYVLRLEDHQRSAVSASMTFDVIAGRTADLGAVTMERAGTLKIRTGCAVSSQSLPRVRIWHLDYGTYLTPPCFPPREDVLVPFGESWLWTGVPPGPIRVEARARGLVPYTEETFIDPGVEREIDAWMEPGIPVSVSVSNGSVQETTVVTVALVDEHAAYEVDRKTVDIADGLDAPPAAFTVRPGIYRVALFVGESTVFQSDPLEISSARRVEIDWGTSTQPRVLLGGEDSN